MKDVAERLHRKHEPPSWEEKFRQNVARDRRKIEALHQLGWNALVLWECETEDKSKLESRLIDFLSPETKK